jgi:hypothetical protein
MYIEIYIYNNKYKVMKLIFLSIFTLIIFSNLAAQSVGINTTTPNTSAVLDVNSNAKGFLPPRMTTGQRNAITTPAPGLIIYNITTNSIETWNSAKWISLLPVATNPGDMLYWDGNNWTILPKGDPGKVLKADATGIPTWSTSSGIASGGKTFLILSGNITNAEAAAKIANETGPNTQFVSITNTTVLTSVDFSGLADLEEVNIESNAVLSSVTCNTLTKCSGNFFIQGNQNLSSISFLQLNKIGRECRIKSNLALNNFTLPLLNFADLITVETNSVLQSFSLPALASTNTLNVLENPIVTNFSLTGLTKADAIFIFGNDLLTTFSIPSIDFFRDLQVLNNIALTVVALPQLDSCYSIKIENFSPVTALTSFSFPTLSVYHNNLLITGALPSTQVNGILNKLVTVLSPASGHTITLTQNPPAPPTGQGLIDKATLISMGNTVNTN